MSSGKLQFSGIVERLDTALGASRQERNSQNIARDAEEGAGELAHVMDALRSIQSSRTELAQAIRGLVTYTEELQAMSSQVEKIAFNTNMLAVNAAIEAAHAGDTGRGFAVVAQEVLALSVTARETGKRIAEKVGMKPFCAHRSDVAPRSSTHRPADLGVRLRCVPLR